MSEKCSISTCGRAAHALCHGCKSNFCREHMFEHSLSTHLQLNPLIDEANLINTEFKKLNLQNLLRHSYQQLEEWRQKSHQIIDIYFTEKTHDLDLYIDNKMKEYKNELHDIQNKIVLYTREQETTHEQINLLSFQIQSLQRNINKIKQNDIYIQINPLVIDQNLIHFDPIFHASSLPPVHRVIDRNDQSFTSIATNNQLLLLHHEGTLLLVDKDLTTYKKISWTYGSIFDMCYSSTLKQFIIITENEVFLVNEVNMNINKVRSIPWQQWFSGTCSDTSLYLSTKVYNSSLVQFNLLPKIEFFKKWTSSDICSHDEAIDGIIYNKNTLALMISNDKTRVIRLELRSVITHGKIWSLPLDIIYNEKQAFRFCSINHNEWLVADHSNSRLLHITKDGRMKEIGAYQPPPCCVTEFGNDVLAISTKSVVHLHKL